ncbi:TPRXL [Fagus crenata]
MAEVIGQRENNMIAGNKEDRKWSDKKVEGDDGVRTVECLRGRLVAERQASKVAKENADLLGNKLIELENQLKEETKLRNKAEKKLKFLMKKLESLNISTISVESEQSSTSEKCEMSCRSSTSSSGSRDPEECEPKSHFTSPTISQNLEHNVSESTTSTLSHASPSTENDCSPQGIASASSNSNYNHDDPSHKFSTGSEDPKTDNHSCSSLKSSIVENESDNEDNVDNSLALVPVSFPMTSKTVEVKPLNESVSKVLDALRHAREEIQSSMQRSHMVHVGPI